ncbi:hypothetical protein WN51_07125 [Melipona quadrifasciata]|uniref:Uncharacterized protein n=1 Tax=Melipona quadrifasciata TaxID=166423 RepID=A0A0N0BC17_9HYME|nr:hypothetical protein WN51_07125 [Melipona quadrifasciata]
MNKNRTATLCVKTSNIPQMTTIFQLTNTSSTSSFKETFSFSVATLYKELRKYPRHRKRVPRMLKVLYTALYLLLCQIILHTSIKSQVVSSCFIQHDSYKKQRGIRENYGYRRMYNLKIY